MGITIRSKRHSADMGWAGFARFRNLVAEQVGENFHEHYRELADAHLETMTDAEQKRFCEAYDKRTNRFIEEGVVTLEVADFLYQADDEGKIDRKQARELYALIKHCTDQSVFGYIGRRDCATMADMKAILSDQTQVRWR